MERRRGVRLILGLAVWLAVIVPAVAHPHVLVDARVTVRLDAESRVVALRQAWTLDEGFSAFAKQGLDTNGDGRFSREELAPLAEVNVTSLAEFRWFTHGNQDGRRLTFQRPTDYHLEHDDATGRLTLHFTLALQAPAPTKGPGVLLRVFDPEYFVAISLVEDPAAVGREGGAAACRLAVKRPAALDPVAAMELARVPASVRNLPANLSQLTADLANDITVTCP